MPSSGEILHTSNKDKYKKIKVLFFTNIKKYKEQIDNVVPIIYQCHLAVSFYIQAIKINTNQYKA